MNILSVIESTEGKIQKQITKYLELCGYEVIRHNAGNARYNVKGSKAGMPDLQVLIGKGMSVFIEVKTPKGKLSDIQKKKHNELESKGYRVIVARKLEDVFFF